MHLSTVAYSKRIVCLANSRKHSGTCVAGIELVNGVLKGWIRPISERPSEELSLDERRFEDGRDVVLLDIADIRFKQVRPHACQTENQVIDDAHHWARAGKYDVEKLLARAETAGPLWVDGDSSYSGVNDRVPVDAADRLASSLMLIAPSNARAVVGLGLTKRQVRLEFNLDAIRYRLAVTDPHVEAE